RTWHKGPSIMGFEDEVEQSFGRPCRQCNGRLKRTCELTSYCRRIAQHPHVFHPPRLFTVFMVTTSASWEGSWERLFAFRAWRWRSRPAPDRGADSAGRELSARPAASVR